RIAQTGIIATVELPSTAQALCALGRYAVVAHGSTGVSLIDLARGRDPTVIARVDTPGEARSVACTGSTLVVADGFGGLALIDASDPPTAEIVSTVFLPGRAERVAARAGLAFVGSGRLLSVVDVDTGHVLDSRDFGETIRDLAIEGDSLWVFSSSPGASGSHSVSELPFEPRLPTPTSRFTVAGNVRPAFAMSGMFVEHERVWLAGIYDRVGGDPGIEVLAREGASLELLASPEPIVAFDVALDGSGRAIFAGTNPSYALADLGVLDSSEPLDTGAVAAVFPIPGQTRSVLVAGGLAYVAAADLHVVSYVPYDTLGVPPSIAFEMGTLITQRVAEEGKLVSVGVDASDDVQLREAQLYVD